MQFHIKWEEIFFSLKLVISELYHGGFSGAVHLNGRFLYDC